MTAKRLFVLFLSLAFLLGTFGLAVAQEKKADKPMAKVKTAEGVVKTVSDTNLVIEGKDKKELSFAISGKVAESAKKLKAGDTVTVAYAEADGKMTASKVTAKAAKAAKTEKK